MKQRSLLKLLAPVVWLALACAEEPMRVRSVGPGDDERDAGGDDAGEGGDGDEPATLVQPELIPTPDSAFEWRPLALNNEGHVLLGSHARDGSVREVIWRGGDDFVEVELPAGTRLLSHISDRRYCLFDDERVLTYLASGTVLLDEGVAVTVDGLNEPVDCNGAGQGVTGGGIWGSGTFAPFPAGAAERGDVIGVNDHGGVAFWAGYWEEGTFTPYGDELFVPYHGPSGDGLVLGSYDMWIQDGEPAVLWSAKTGKIMKMLPLLPDAMRPVPGPHFVSENGDVVVGTNVRGDLTNEVYLYRNGNYYGLTVSELSTPNPIDINDRSQVLCAPPKRFFGEGEPGGFVGVLFTPLD